MEVTKSMAACNIPGAPNECQLTIRLLEMLQRTKYELVQENGQRRLTAPEIVSGEKQRVKGAEIFLGRLPRDCYEDELMPILEKIGRLCELRLMLDFSGSTRGYAFASFEDTKTARTACIKLDSFEIRPGHRIGVVKSVDNCRLFFGGVPKNKCKEEFLQELNKILDGITNVYLYPSAHDKTQNRGFIFVEFKDHRAAAMARRKLIPGKVMLWDHEIAVDWADPEPGDPIDEEIMETVTALFVRNLSLDMPQQKIRELFQKTTKIPVLKLKKINHFAFVHYENRKAAETVLNIMTKRNGVADAEGWEISWAKPIGATKMLERQKCINEAVAISHSRNKDQNRRKQALIKKHNSKLPKNDYNNNDKADPVLLHMTALRNFMKDEFSASCHFNCLQVAASPNFVCKITIFKNEQLLLEYHGDIMTTTEDAIVAACSKMYNYVSSAFQSCVFQDSEQYRTEQKLGVNPVVGSPVGWDNYTRYN
ncbi:APOBEC1 complementation factor [Lasioglossum baleicum]|uniref:APOBEC1 complementation factor n=1 Tax=Lasioglossum baleicum TaxID=434251 RepID=UPI003FCECEE3